MYAKIAKWISWALIIISTILLITGFATGFESNGGVAVDVLLRWGYILLVAAIGLVIVLSITFAAITNPKDLIKLGLGLVVVAFIVLAAYLTASSSPLVGYIGEQPSTTILKLSTTLLNLTYLLSACAIVSIVLGEILSAVRK